MSSSADPASGAARKEGAIRKGVWSALVQPWWQRITFRLTLLVLAVSILPPLTLGVLAMRSARVAQEREVRQQNTAVARWGVDKVQSYVDNIIENMHLLEELGELRSMDPATAKPPMSFFLSFMEDIKEVSLIDARGQERVRLAENTLVPDFDRSSYISRGGFQQIQGVTVRCRPKVLVHGLREMP